MGFDGTGNDETAPAFKWIFATEVLVAGVNAAVPGMNTIANTEIFMVAV